MPISGSNSDVAQRHQNLHETAQGRTAPQQTTCTPSCCPRSRRPPHGTAAWPLPAGVSTQNTNRALRQDPCF